MATSTEHPASPCPHCQPPLPTIDIRPALSAHLKQFRQDRGWTQEVFAHHLGIRREVLSCHERGTKEILLSTLFTWAARLGIPPETLLPKLPPEPKKGTRSE